jgi:hypothetical protein
MAKRPVVEVECARCDRKEYRETSESDTFQGEGTPDFYASLQIGEERVEINFLDLCTPCASTIKGHLAQIGKKIEGVSPVREKKGNGAKILEGLSHQKTEERKAEAMKKGHVQST